MVAPALEARVLSTGVSIFAFFKVITGHCVAILFYDVGADFIFTAFIRGTGVPVVAFVFRQAVFRARQGKMNALGCSIITDIIRTPVTVVTVGIQHAGFR